MGGLSDLVDNLHSMSDRMVTRAKPEYGVVKNNLDNQTRMRGVLQQLADEQQQSMDAAAPQQGAQQNGAPVPAASPLDKYKQLLIQSAQANPTAENTGAAVSSQSPYFSQLMAMNAQQEAAKIEQTKSEATKNLVVDTPTGKVLVNPNNGHSAPIGAHTYATPEVQKLADLTHFAGTQAPPAPAPGLTPSETVPGVPPAAGQPGSGIPSVQPLITAAFRTPDQQAAVTEKAVTAAKTSQEADQDIVNTKAATDHLMPILNQLDSLNENPNLPSVMPEEQAHSSNFLHSIGLTNGATADAAKQWEQTNSQKLVGGIKQFTAEGSGGRMDLPIAHALMGANGIELTGSKTGRADRINQARIELYNANIIAKNRSMQFKDPNAKPAPTIPLNFKGKIYTMQELQKAAQIKGMQLPDVVNKVKASGSLVVE